MIEGAISETAAASPDSLDATLWDPKRRPGAAAVAAGSEVLADASGRVVSHSCLDVWHDVRLMHRIAMARRRKRFEAGALALHKAKLHMTLDPGTGNPTGFGTYPIWDSNRMIEEYMLLANYLVAQQLITHAGDRAVLRHHPPIEADRATAARRVAAELGYSLDLSSSGAIHNSLVSVYHSDEDAGRVIEYLVTKPMKPAQYFAAGSLPQEKWPHYALAIPYYTHFTSPIRRYADVLVHRLLAESLGEVDPRGADDVATLTAQCEACNERKRAAKEAQERSDLVYLTVMLRDAPQVVEAIVCDISGSKFFTVLIPSMALERTIHYDRCGWVATYNEAAASAFISKAGSTAGACAGGGGKPSAVRPRGATPVTPGGDGGRGVVVSTATTVAAPVTPSVAASAALASAQTPSGRQVTSIAKWLLRNPETAESAYGVDVASVVAAASSGAEALDLVRAVVRLQLAVGNTALLTGAATAAVAGAVGGAGDGAGDSDGDDVVGSAGAGAIDAAATDLAGLHVSAAPSGSFGTAVSASYSSATPETTSGTAAATGKRTPQVGGGRGGRRAGGPSGSGVPLRPQVAADAVIFAPDFAAAGKPPPPGATPATFNDGGIRLQHMTTFKARVTGDTSRVPIDIHIELLELSRV